MEKSNLSQRPFGKTPHVRTNSYRILFLAFLLIILCGTPWRSRAGTTRFVAPAPFGDDANAPCDSPDTPCAHIQTAINNSMAGDLIEVFPGTYTENVHVNQSVTIQGDAFNPSIVDGNQLGPVFIIDSGNTVTLSMLTIMNGNAGDAASNAGGGIQNNGTLTVLQSTINGNKATSGHFEAAGCGIGNFGTLTVINSTISGNQGIGGSSVGGGVFIGGTATLVNTTINGNSASNGGGILIGNKSTLNFTNTIISGSLGGGADCVNDGTIGTNSHNLVQDGSCSPAVSGNPKLGPLQNNGGPTNTHALLPTSPAIDAGDDSVVDPMGTYMLTTDQRGVLFPRKVCAHVDIGAFEANSGVPPIVNCPGNITTFTDAGQTTATVSFSVTASDSCGNTLAPTCKIGSTIITSPHAFPPGITSVQCSATDSQMQTGFCSFTVNVTLLNVCIQDDRSGDTFRWNSQTGQYTYTRCKDKFTLAGTGKVGQSNGLVTLTDSRVDRRINAAYNPGTKTGRANITLVNQGVLQTIVVNQTNPNATCKCAF